MTSADQLTLVSPRHEQTAGHMADAYLPRVAPAGGDADLDRARLGQLPMALGWRRTDSSAFLAITANVPTSQFNRGAFQEPNMQHQADFPNSVIKPLVKRSFQPSRVEMLPLALRQAVDHHDQRAARAGQPGLPYNLFQERPRSRTRRRAAGFNSRRSGAARRDVAGARRSAFAAARR